METIKPLSSIPGLGSFTSRHGGQHQQPGSERALGELLKATVLETRANNRFLLDFSGTRITASSRAPLSVGQQLQLQVVATAPQIELAIVSGPSSLLAGKSLVLLGNAIDLSSLFSSLQQLSPPPSAKLSPLSLETLSSFLPKELQSIIAGRDGGDFIGRLINRLGINLESLLARGEGKAGAATLKASLLEILQQYQGAEKVTEQAGRLLATLELYQFAQLQLNQQNLLIFPLPLPFFEQGFLLVERREDDSGETDAEESDLHYSLHLSMSGLGHLKIAFWQNRDGLFIRFQVEDQQRAAFLAEHQDLLKQMISSVPVQSIVFSDGAENPALELMRTVLPGEESLINTKV